MVTLTSSTIRQNLWETIYDTVKAANLLSSTVTVVSAYVDEDPSFPMIVINPVDKGRDNPSFNRANWTDNLMVEIEIYTKKAKQLDQLCDALDSLISPLSVTGVMLSGWVESKGYPTSNDNQLHLKSITLSYMRG